MLSVMEPRSPEEVRGSQRKSVMIAHAASSGRVGVCEQVCVCGCVSVSHCHAWCVSVVREAQPLHCALGESYRLVAGAGWGQGSRFNPRRSSAGWAQLSAHQPVSGGRGA